MSLGLVGRKVGMTRVFSDDGVSIPVTVIEVEPNRVSQIKTLETDGYVAVQVVTGTRRASRVTRPMAGHYKKAGVEAGRGACPPPAVHHIPYIKSQVFWWIATNSDKTGTRTTELEGLSKQLPL